MYMVYDNISKETEIFETYDDALTEFKYVLIAFKEHEDLEVYIFKV